MNRHCTTTDYEAFEEGSVEDRRLLRQEELILEVTEALSHALEDLAITRTELAERLGKTKGFVSQILGGGRNLTLRTLSDLVDAMECSVEVHIAPSGERLAEVLEWPEAAEASPALFLVPQYEGMSYLQWKPAA